MTKFKNELRKFLKENGHKEADGIVIDGKLYAYRHGTSESISVKSWYALFKSGRISENQFMQALSVSVTEARKAIGTDQIEDISVTTTSKTESLKTEDAPKDAVNGDIVKYEVAAPKKAETKVTKKPEVGTGVTATNVRLSRNTKIIRATKGR